MGIGSPGRRSWGGSVCNGEVATPEPWYQTIRFGNWWSEDIWRGEAFTLGRLRVIYWPWPWPCTVVASLSCAPGRPRGDIRVTVEGFGRILTPPRWYGVWMYLRPLAWNLRMETVSWDAFCTSYHQECPYCVIDGSWFRDTNSSLLNDSSKNTWPMMLYWRRKSARLNCSALRIEIIFVVASAKRRLPFPVSACVVDKIIRAFINSRKCIFNARTLAGLSRRA